MFNKDFYPTPEHVIIQMLNSVELQGKKVLEPSAGKGDIIKYLNSQGANVSFCEINRDLQEFCSGTARFIKSDFLDVKSDEISHIDLIVMNPPFSADEQHITHAYEIAPEGCEIIALCNYETVNNKYNYGRRTLSKIINEFGTVQNIGNCFSMSERKTEVEIGLIHIYKPRKDGSNEFDGYFDLSEEEEQQENGIMQYNEIRNIVNRYVAGVKKFDGVIESSREINELIKPINYRDSIKFGGYEKRESNYYEINRDEFKKNLQKSAWKTVFNKMNMDKYVTKSVMSDINKFIENQEKVPFTMGNVYKMIDVIVGTQHSRMNNVLEEVFDFICSRCKDNSEAKEGWKTNSSYKVNKNFILPYCCSFEYGHMSIAYRSFDEINDMIKAFCYLSGRNFDETIPIWKYFQDNKIKPNTWVNFNDIFMIKGFKKQTVHFKFIDDDLWYNFNKTVAKIKGWNLPTRTDNKKTGKEKNKNNGVIKL